MRQARIVDAEFPASLREQGVASPDRGEAVVLETDGSWSVVERSDSPAPSLSNLPRVGGSDGRAQ